MFFLLQPRLVLGTQGFQLLHLLFHSHGLLDKLLYFLVDQFRKQRHHHMAQGIVLQLAVVQECGISTSSRRSISTVIVTMHQLGSSCQRRMQRGFLELHRRRLLCLGLLDLVTSAQQFGMLELDLIKIKCKFKLKKERE